MRAANRKTTSEEMPHRFPGCFGSVNRFKIKWWNRIMKIKVALMFFVVNIFEALIQTSWVDRCTCSMTCTGTCSTYVHVRKRVING